MTGTPSLALEPAERGPWQRGGGRPHEAHAGRARRRRVHRQDRDDRGNRVDPGDPALRDQLPEAAAAELAVDREVRPRAQGGEQPDHLGVDVEQRQRAVATVVAGEPVRGDDARGACAPAARRGARSPWACPWCRWCTGRSRRSHLGVNVSEKFVIRNEPRGRPWQPDALPPPTRCHLGRRALQGPAARRPGRRRRSPPARSRTRAVRRAGPRSWRRAAARPRRGGAPSLATAARRPA